ncbi:MAG: carboxylating nicotinate-nucleotide diphosphorylase [Armatimonadetes bacterium]|nr:carboxylating nicotinate-nucleotide diphosphorylase [Armatimonadota bacterium]
MENICLRELIDLALKEDIGPGDVTTNSIIPPDRSVAGLLVAKEEGVVAGLPVAEAVFRRLDPAVNLSFQVREGEQVTNARVLARVEGNARALLTGERVALNFLQRLSGIATHVHRLVRLLEGCKAKIVDTRKTTPGLRLLEKYAVRVGGGNNHRFGLYDAVLIKDNHLKVTGSIKRAIQQARSRIPLTMKIEVEVENLAGVEEALAAGADIIMLDNMDLPTMREAVNFVAGRALLEASGGITEKNILAVAQTGVDFISVGALTHSARALDLSLEVTSLSA